jgi:hypothetical protein
MIIGNFLTLLGITLFFATDMHHLVICRAQRQLHPVRARRTAEHRRRRGADHQNRRRRVSGWHSVVGAVHRLRASVQHRTRRAGALDAADAGLFCRPAALDPDRAFVLPVVARGDDELLSRLRGRRAARARSAWIGCDASFHALVIARSQRVRPEVAGPMTSSATKQSSFPRKPLDCFAVARNDEGAIHLR